MDPEQHHFLSRRSPPPPPCPDRALVYLCVLCDGLLDSPMQSSCGDRMCKGCLEILDQSLRQRDTFTARCPVCGEQLMPAHSCLQGAVCTGCDLSQQLLMGGAVPRLPHPLQGVSTTPNKMSPSLLLCDPPTGGVRTPQDHLSIQTSQV
jgi:hypothetical protein